MGMGTGQLVPSIRIDKSLSYNYLYFKKYSADDSQLMFLLLAYFAKERQRNLFGYGVLDPVQFCKEMGLEPTHIIWRKHPNPKQTRDYSRDTLEKSGKEIFDTILENSLYCLATDSYNLETIGSYVSKSGVFEKVTSVKFIHFITELRKREIKEGRNKKRIYEYVLSKEFIDNMSFLFFNINIKSLKQSLKKEYEGLYLKLCNTSNEMYSSKQIEKELDFSKVKELLNIKSDKSTYIKQKINRAFKEIVNYPDLQNKITIKWFKPTNHKYNYGIKVICNIQTDEELLKQQNSNMWNSIKKEHIRNNLFETFIKTYQYTVTTVDKVLLQKMYIKWLKDSHTDKKIKMEAIAYSLQKFYNNPSISNNIEEEKQYNKRQKNKSIQQVGDIFNNNEKKKQEEFVIQGNNNNQILFNTEINIILNRLTDDFEDYI